MVGIMQNQSCITDIHDMENDRNCLKFAREKNNKNDLFPKGINFQ